MQLLIKRFMTIDVYMALNSHIALDLQHCLKLAILVGYINHHLPLIHSMTRDSIILKHIKSSEACGLETTRKQITLW